MTTIYQSKDKVADIFFVINCLNFYQLLKIITIEQISSHFEEHRIKGKMVDGQ